MKVSRKHEKEKNFVSILEARSLGVAQDDLKVTALCLRVPAAGMAQPRPANCFSTASPEGEPFKAQTTHL